jgi:peptidoglycan-N-acetylglucosamine deacetylase
MKCNITLTTIIIIFLGILANDTPYAQDLAITFDDLPVQLRDETSAHHREVSERILHALAKFNVPVTAFVNESCLYNKDKHLVPRKIAILQLWLDCGHDLGNHTYSHQSFRRTELNAFKQEVLQGAVISKKLMDNLGRKYQYFRYPYLDRGNDIEKRATFEKFLQQEGYIIAPITINTDDWVFNYQLIKHPEQANEIVNNYLKYTQEQFMFYKQKYTQKIIDQTIAQTWFKYDNLFRSYYVGDEAAMVYSRGYRQCLSYLQIRFAVYTQAYEGIFYPHTKDIWLLHVNLINSYVMEELLKIASKFGYYFVMLDDVLQSH